LSWINKPVSRGEVRLRDPDPRIGPMARFNYLADPRDIQRLVKAFRFMATLFTAPALAAVSEHASPAVYTALAKRFGRPGFSRFALTFAVGLAIDASPALRRKFFAELVAAGRPLAALLADDTALEDYVRDHAFGQWHPCGTCRMGPSSDRQSVIDPITARIHGLDGIRIIDASVMPTIPRANLNLPTMMIAEKFAAGVG
jgi:5-(hydroxymethyl)furfural/furfural oxidase